MASKKEILKRVKSIEDFLGIKYSPADDKDSYPEHYPDSYGRMNVFEDMRKAHGKKKET